MSERYTADEHELLMEAAAKVLMAAITADRTGPMAYFSEMTAAGTFLFDARQRYRDNRLVQDLYGRHEEEGSLEVDPERVTHETLMADIDRIAAVLRRDEEGMGFRRFLYELAERVASASREGLFGRRISADEAAFLQELRLRLGLGSGDQGAT